MADNALTTMTSRIESTEERRRRLFRTIARVSLGVAAGTLVLSIVLGLLMPEFPFEYMVPILALFIGALLLSLWLNQRGHFSWAITIHLVSTTALFFVMMYLVDGTAGPLAVGLIEIPVIAAMLGGRRAARWTVFNISALYLLMALLESLGVLHPLQALGPTSQVATVGAVVVTLAVTAFFVAQSSGQMARALSIAQERREQLIQETQRAEDAVAAEKEARAREAKAALGLRRTIYEYATFLERVIAGDYEARLELDQVTEAGHGAAELVALGHQLNTTVESLVTALKDLQATQQRYIAETWRSFIAATSAHDSFQYEDGDLTPTPGAWLPTMDDTLREADVVTSDDELALPMVLRGEIIGAIGIQREDGTEWSNDELALARAIVDQLTQTIETLRLLEDTQRRAAREETVGQMTTHFTQSLDIEALLQTAVRELGQTLAVDEVSVHVGAPTPVVERETEEEASS